MLFVTVTQPAIYGSSTPIQHHVRLRYNNKASFQFIHSLCTRFQSIVSVYIIDSHSCIAYIANYMLVAAKAPTN